MGRRSIAVVLALAGVLASWPPSASAEPGAVIVTYFYLFIPGDSDIGRGIIRIRQGKDLEYLNLDSSSHSVTSDAVTPDERSLFDSGIKASGEHGDVPGVPALRPGDYPFHCELHPFLMYGTLRVEP